MAKSLIIVESPAKARTLQRYLGKAFIVKASVGHIRDLPVSTLGVDVEKDFTPNYVIIRGKSKIIKELRAAAQKADEIFLTNVITGIQPITKYIKKTYTNEVSRKLLQKLNIKIRLG